VRFVTVTSEGYSRPLLFTVEQPMQLSTLSKAVTLALSLTAV